jgi:hypothetical protein
LSLLFLLSLQFWVKVRFKFQSVVLPFLHRLGAFRRQGGQPAEIETNPSIFE